jgi:hypothetical protein
MTQSIPALIIVYCSAILIAMGCTILTYGRVILHAQQSWLGRWDMDAHLPSCDFSRRDRQPPCSPGRSSIGQNSVERCERRPTSN